MSPLHWRSLSQLVRELKSGASRSVDVTESMLERIDRLDRGLKSYVRTTPETALRQAKEQDQRREQGLPLGALHGVPIAVKDLFFVQGQIAASGTQVMADYRPQYNATVINKLQNAGAVVIGKTQLTEGAFGAHHPEIDPPRNPYNLDHWTGVSSSGSGVAVAAGLAFGALGTDTGGSIRFPSASCGLVGIKPSYGRVSRYGAFPLAATLDHMGPMTRTVEDAARMLGVIAGADSNDPTTVPDAVPNYCADVSSIRGTKLGVDWDYASHGVDRQVVAALKHVAEGLEQAGAELVPLKMPATYQMLVDGWGVTCGVECAQHHREFYPTKASQYGPVLSALIELGLNADASDYQHLEDLRVKFRFELDSELSAVDGWLMPAMPVLPPRAASMEAGNTDQEHVPLITFTAPFDYSGHPTITVPVGLSVEGLPMSVQVVSRHLDEVALIRIGGAIENLCGQMPHPDLGDVG